MMLHIRSKTIIAILLVFLTVSLCFFYLFVRQRDESQQAIINSQKTMVTSLVSALTAQIDRQYSVRVQSMVVMRGALLQAFADRNREGLAREAQLVYRMLSKENSHLDHLDFVQPDHTLFLRVQEPPPGQESPEKTLPAPAGGNGFVYGDSGLLYRIIQPVAREGRPVGSIVVYVRIGALIEEISRALDIHTAVALRTEVVGRAPAGNVHAIPSGDYSLFPYDDPFFTEKGAKILYRGAELEFKLSGRSYLVFPSFPIRDVQGRELGSVLQAVEVTALTATSNRDIVRLVLFTAVVMLLAAGILYLAFSTLYSQLLGLNETLNQKNDELSRIGHQLEEQVAARTAELATTNARLQDEIDLRHEVNLSLSKSIEEWQSTFDAISDPVTILDKNLEVVIANKAAQDLLTCGEQEIVGRTCHQLFAGLATRCPSCPASEVFVKGVKQESEIEHQHLGKTLLVSCSPIFDGSELMGYVHTTKDITQEKALKKQLAQAQKMEAIATLAGGIAHDFNNILGAILGNADLLLFRLAAKTAPGDKPRPELKYEDIEAHIQAIKKAGNRAKDLVGQILAFSRQGKTQRQNAIITPVIKEAVKLLRSSLPANIEIKADLAGDLCHIYADLSQVHQVFMNLCTNAAQAMADHGGKLTVTLNNFEAGIEERKRYPDLKPGRYAALAVEDTGHGMSPEVMERIFDPFFTTRDVGEGTGMGLAVIHGIISSHDGVLDVKSQVDVGSTFTVFFPCANVGSESGQDIILGMPRGKEKILFVDDEEDIVRMTSRMLEYLGYTVYPATSGDQALTMLGQEPFAVDLLITDYSMPGISGINLAKEAVRLRPALPVMLCSGFSESVVIEDEAKKFIRRFMSKPLDMKKLAVAIREMLPVAAGE